MTRPLSPGQEAHLRDLLLAPRLDAHLPWVFANKAVLSTLTGQCPRCHQDLELLQRAVAENPQA